MKEYHANLMKFFQVLNLTELELDRVDIRVGLSGALYYMDGSPQAVRQLRNLVSQVPFHNLYILDPFICGSWFPILDPYKLILSACV